MTNKAKLLIVDDEAMAAEFLYRSLRDLPNCEVSLACSGEQALLLLEQQPFDLLITDYNMPHMDGITLTMRVGQLYPQMDVIMVSGCVDQALREWADHAPIWGLMEKPVPPAQIRRAVLKAWAA